MIDTDWYIFTKGVRDVGKKADDVKEAREVDTCVREVSEQSKKNCMGSSMFLGKIKKCSHPVFCEGLVKKTTTISQFVYSLDFLYHTSVCQCFETKGKRSSKLNLKAWGGVPSVLWLSLSADPSDKSTILVHSVLDCVRHCSYIFDYVIPVQVLQQHRSSLLVGKLAQISLKLS